MKACWTSLFWLILGKNEKETSNAKKKENREPKENKRHKTNKDFTGDYTNVNP